MRIYKIKNNINGNLYIGQTTSNGKIRWLGHRNKLRKNIHPNKHLQSAWNKYDETSFSYELVTETCIGLLDILEKSYIDKHNSADNKYGYNKDCGGYLSRLRAPVSEETRKKLSIALKGKKRNPHSAETKARLSLANKGRIPANKGVANGKKGIPTGYCPSGHTRHKMSMAATGRKRKPLSIESLARISEAAKSGWIKRKLSRAIKDV